MEFISLFFVEDERSVGAHSLARTLKMALREVNLENILLGRQTEDLKHK